MIWRPSSCRVPLMHLVISLTWLTSLLPGCKPGSTPGHAAPSPPAKALGGLVPAPRSGYVSLALSASGGCVVTKGGRVACWGKDTLARGTTWLEARLLYFVDGLKDIVRLSGSSGICATDRAGATSCWGLGPWGATKQGFSFRPTRAPHLNGLTLALAPGLDGRHGCGLAPKGEVWCWGGNGMGQAGQRRGLGDFASYLKPALVLREAAAVATGARHSCALDRRRRVSCWGNAEGGALGDGDAHERPCTFYTPVGRPGGPSPHLARKCEGPDPYLPTPVLARASSVTALAVGWQSTCAATQDKVLCWGDKFGAAPRAIAIPDVVELTGANRMFCARQRTGAVHCWGSAPDARLVSLTPQRLEPLTGASTIRVLDARVCGLVGGAVRCWGRNASGLPIDDFTNVGPPP